MHHVSLVRLYLLRAVYLLLSAGLFIFVWPAIVRHDAWEPAQGFVNCMLGAFGLLCAVGVRYPLQMLPLLLWEMLWKLLWLTIVAVPAMRAGPLSPAMMENLFAVSLAVVIPIAMPWRYLIEHYLKRPGERWSAARPAHG